jgi:hypothetical protein
MKDEEDIYEHGRWNTDLATFSEFQPGLVTNRHSTTASFLLWVTTLYCCVPQVLHKSTLYLKENCTEFDLDIVKSFDNILLLSAFP